MELTNQPIEGPLSVKGLESSPKFQQENFIINPEKKYTPEDLKAFKIQKSIAYKQYYDSIDYEEDIQTEKSISIIVILQISNASKILIIVLQNLRGNPKHLLKAINPSEAALLDTSANSHVRFRLGGERFPPNIYYKIYVHGSLCDINSFAPRDYSSMPKPEKNNGPKITYNQYKVHQKELENEGWYLRIDNNGWRPISHKAFTKTDYVEVFTANKIKYYHFNKEKRLEKNNKLRWLQKIYMNQMKLSQIKEDENKPEQQLEQDEEDEEEKNELDNPFYDRRFLEINDEDLDLEAKKLIDWSEQLDFDKYMQDWYLLSTSNRSDLFAPNQSQKIMEQISGNHKGQWSQESSITQQEATGHKF